MENLETFLQEKAQSIRTHLERMTGESVDESIIKEQLADIGLDLMLVKDKLHEQLIPWIAREFGASIEQAEKFWRLAYFARWSQDNLELGLDEFGDPSKKERD